MRLKREKYISKNPITNTTNPTTNNIKIHQIKTSSMDRRNPMKAQNIYLNKVLQKNLGTEKLSQDPTNLQKNYQNFESSIQNIFSNEESRQKAKNYVLKIRNKQGSPLARSEYHDEKNDFTKTN